jgi:hypothetical protein
MPFTSKEKNREWEHANRPWPGTRQESDTARRHKKRDWLHEILGGACTNCGTSDALDVHHPHGKDEPIKYQWSWERIKEEAMHTILLCSGCHRKHHLRK